MKTKILKNIFFIAMAVLVCSYILIIGAMNSYFHTASVSELKTEAAFLSAAVEQSGTAFLENMGEDPPIRVTLIAADGTVLYDNKADIRTMENHSDREEFIEAVRDGTGESHRYSETLSVKALYYTELLRDGTVLRVSNTQYTVMSLINGLFYPMVVALVLAIILSVFLATRVSRSVIGPINALDLENPDERDVYEELQPLVRRIIAQNRQIHNQIKLMEREHKKQDRMRQEFTANVSHELKTPLTSISGYAELMQNDAAKPEDIRRFAGKIYNQAQRLITLVGDIIKLSQLDEQIVQEPVEALDLFDLSGDVVLQLQPQADQRNITISLEGEHVEIIGAKQILEEMVYNLCDNAIKYNKVGGTVAVSVGRVSGGIELRVADTGIGIPEGDQERIFERFYRVDKSHSKAIGGTGLGLSIVKHAAAYHHAKISLESTLGAGTTISVLFPIRSN